MRQWCAAFLVTITFILSNIPDSFSRDLKIATWNIQTLTTGSRVFPDQIYVRTPSDLIRLKEVAAKIDADVVSLQEIASPAAAAQIFPIDEWQICISGQYFEQYPSLGMPISARCFERLPLPDEPISDTPLVKQFTAFVVRKLASLDTVIKDAPGLGIYFLDPRDQIKRPLRWGVHLEIRHDSRTLQILNIHLKSKCVSGAPWNQRKSEHCKTFAEQGDLLVSIVENLQKPLVVTGDFNRRFDKDDRFSKWLLKKLKFSRIDELGGAACMANASTPPLDHFMFSPDLVASELRTHSPVALAGEDILDLKRSFGDHCPRSLRLKW
jgi:endonuclease/exonuclease/phosphatase family metal-dependent hydrolase